ncbi:MAG: hypothetical protein WCO63_13625 [Bacteroidota bacterium]
MKIVLFAGMFLSVLLWGCKKDDKIDYASLVLGKWINTEVDNQLVLTDATFVLEFKADKTETYASGFVLDANNKSWIENHNYTYSVKEDMIIIDGFNDLGNNFHMEFKILKADRQTLSYSVSKFTVDNVEYPDSKIYTNKKINTDLADKFVSTWYGKSTTPASPDTTSHYWQYFPDGNFHYFYQDSTGTWINKPDNNGKYFLYGDLMASNYTNDLITGGTAKAYECWKINIQGDTMSWTGIRQNGTVTTFQMGKVAAPPL